MKSFVFESIASWVSTIAAVGTDGGVFVVDVDDESIVRASVLEHVESARPLRVGDEIVASRLSAAGEMVVVIGRLRGPNDAPRVSTPTSDEASPETNSERPPAPSGGTSLREDVPETLVLEATESLTLRVGDGSITIRADGKILIKGKDLVSHAKNMNRIKGGAVAIN